MRIHLPAKASSPLRMIFMECTWEKAEGRYFCKAKECKQWTPDGCLLRKVGLTCDNSECKFNVSPIPGIYQCGCMDVSLDADGRCLGFKT